MTESTLAAATVGTSKLCASTRAILPATRSRGQARPSNKTARMSEGNSAVPRSIRVRSTGRMLLVLRREQVETELIGKRLWHFIFTILATCTLVFLRMCGGLSPHPGCLYGAGDLRAELGEESNESIQTVLTRHERRIHEPLPWSTAGSPPILLLNLLFMEDIYSTHQQPFQHLLHNTFWPVHLLGISGIQLSRDLQKNSPFGGKTSGSSSDPTQMYRYLSLTAS